MGFKNVKRRGGRHLRSGSSIEIEQDDTNFYRCQVCGWVCDADEVEQAGERVNASRELTGVKLIVDGDWLQPIAKRGCPNCGSLYSRER